jgi:hypothetical protein
MLVVDWLDVLLLLWMLVVDWQDALLCGAAAGGLAGPPAARVCCWLCTH